MLCLFISRRDCFLRRCRNICFLFCSSIGSNEKCVSSPKKRIVFEQISSYSWKLPIVMLSNWFRNSLLHRIKISANQFKHKSAYKITANALHKFEIVSVLTLNYVNPIVKFVRSECFMWPNQSNDCCDCALNCALVINQWARVFRICEQLRAVLCSHIPRPLYSTVERLTQWW